MKILLVIAALTLTGCAPNMVKVIKLDSQGQWNPLIDARVDGCIVESKGEIKGIELVYTDDKCLVEVK